MPLYRVKYVRDRAVQHVTLHAMDATHAENTAQRWLRRLGIRVDAVLLVKSGDRVSGQLNLF